MLVYNVHASMRPFPYSSGLAINLHTVDPSKLVTFPTDFALLDWGRFIYTVLKKLDVFRSLPPSVARTL